MAPDDLKLARLGSAQPRSAELSKGRFAELGTRFGTRFQKALLPSARYANAGERGSSAASPERFRLTAGTS